MSASPGELLHAWLVTRAQRESLAWLDARVDEGTDVGRAGRTDPKLFLAFGLAPRKFPGTPLVPSTSDLEAAHQARAGWDPSRWTLLHAARTLLLLALPSRDPSEYGAALDQLQNDADLGELVAEFQALPLLPHPASHRERTREAIRSNMTPVFEAVALRNPYPSEELDDAGWAQLILKCLFVGSPLFDVHGLDARATPELGRMLSALAHERWSAGRAVPAELWRCVGPFADGEQLADLERVLSTGTERERAAVALSLRDNPRGRNLLDAHGQTVATATQRHPSWDAIRSSPK